jgi:hypothetical protein
VVVVIQFKKISICAKKNNEHESQEGDSRVAVAEEVDAAGAYTQRRLDPGLTKHCFKSTKSQEGDAKRVIQEWQRMSSQRIAITHTHNTALLVQG